MGARRASTDGSIRHLISGHRRGGSHMKRAWMVCLIVAAAAVAAAATASPAAALVPDCSHGWFWQMPQPATSFNDCAVVGAGDVWAVGTGGLIEHSTDGGATWTTQQSGTEADLWSVSFTDDQHGWAVGGQPTNAAPGVILRTIDGGTTWSDVTPAGLTETLSDASFTDPEHGWIGTADGHLLHTTNAGATWQTLTLPGAVNGYDTVDFVDAAHGWAGGPTNLVYRTTNAGKTWTASRLPATGRYSSIVELDFADRYDGWALTQDYWGASLVLATNDGGRSWRPVPTGQQFTTDICARSATNVWLIGSNGYDYYDLQTPTLFLHSTDGGFTWKTATVAGPAMPYTIGVGSASVCAVGDGILHSSDAGATWQAASSGQQYQFAAADAVSATDVWAVDTSGALLHSTDGARFAEQPNPVQGSGALMGVTFPDANDGWAVGTGAEGGSVILHTADGGATWGPQQSNLSGGLVGVDFLDASTGWAISDDPWGDDTAADVSLEHTTDGGATWIPQYIAAGADFTTVDFVNGSTGWVAGGWWSNSSDWDVGAIWASTNGGFTWTKEKLPKEAPEITGLQFLSATDGWAVGTGWDDNGYATETWLLHTTDGGATWTRVPGLDDTWATTVHFLDAQHGWLGGSNGVYATSDGGDTWQRVAAGYGVEAIAATDLQHVWAFGDGFLVSTLDAAGDTAAPATLDEHAAFGWHRKSVTIGFSANDIGGSDVASTQTSFDGAAWKPGAGLAVPAYADHHFDGEHTVLYRSTDNAGNQEQTESSFVGIDTLGPACSVPRASVVDTGKRGILYFQASDQWSGVSEVSVHVVDAHDHVVRSFFESTGGGAAFSYFPYYWLPFRCTLKPGTYHVVVRARDVAGNPQATVGRGTLRVVRSGAPAYRTPGWPPGLFSEMYWFGRLNHGLRPAWLLRLPGGPAVVHTALHRGAWQAAHWPEVRTKR